MDQHIAQALFGDSDGLTTTDINNLNGENGFVLDVGTNFVDINNDGFDDIVGSYRNKAYVLFGTDETMPDTVSIINAAEGEGIKFVVSEVKYLPKRLP